MRTLSILFVVTSIYWFCYGQIRKWGININVVDRILLNFDRTAGLFRNILQTKLFVVVFLILSCLGIEGVKEEKITWRKITAPLVTGGVLFFFSWWLLDLPLTAMADAAFYILTLSAGYICPLMGGVWMFRLLKNNLMDDPFSNGNGSSQQGIRLIENEYPISLPTKSCYSKQQNNGFANVANPQRVCICMGSPGNGESYCVVNQFIKQQIEKGYTQYIYDYKSLNFSEIACNRLLNHQRGYKKVPTFYVINFGGPRRSHRCDPIHPDFMTDISDAYESAYAIMLNLNRSWVRKQGDLFVRSPIILSAAVIWFLRTYDNGRYCTFPHAIEFLNKRYEDVFPILTSCLELEDYLNPFMGAWSGDAQDQFQDQIASARILLSYMTSLQLYWVMSGDDLMLDVSSPDDLKILYVGNNPDRQDIYEAASGLYNSRIVELINKKGQLKSSIIIDKLSIIYFKGLDNLIVTARGNKVAVLLCFQDSSQLKRNHGDKGAVVTMNTVDNVFPGRVVGETAKTFSERFSKVLQKRRNVMLSRSDKSTSISTQLDSLIPASKTSVLMWGMFVGAVTDNLDERTEQRISHCEIIVDNEKVKAETARYKKISRVTDFTNENRTDHMKRVVQENYGRIRAGAGRIVIEELERIKNDPVLCKFLLEQN